ncbi:hypothetical protein ACOME3_000524 [Neoechinorhynchus agilis]
MDVKNQLQQQSIENALKTDLPDEVNMPRVTVPTGFIPVHRKRNGRPPKDPEKYFKNEAILCMKRLIDKVEMEVDGKLSCVPHRGRPRKDIVSYRQILDAIQTGEPITQKKTTRSNRKRKAQDNTVEPPTKVAQVEVSLPKFGVHPHLEAALGTIRSGGVPQDPQLQYTLLLAGLANSPQAIIMLNRLLEDATYTQAWIAAHVITGYRNSN